MSSVDKLAKELKSLINESDDRKPKAYDTDAQVVRIEDDILWVHIPGGVEETPVKKTINALPGDTVKVHIENGGAWVSGNASAPPTDDRQANIATNIAIIADNKADEAVKDADRARIAADAAEYEAGRAKEIAEGVEGIAQKAKTDAGIAKTAANESLKGLGMTQEVLDVVNWVATHGVYVKATTYVEGTSYYTVSATEVTDPSQQTDELVSRYYEKDGDIYVKTEDTEYDDRKTYYVVTGTPVPTPKSEDIGQYYTLNVKDAMGDYINSHLALTNEGLYVMSDDSKWKVLIKDDGIDIIDGTGPSDRVVASYGSDIVVGDLNDVNALINADGMNIRSELVDLATFSDKEIELGKNSDQSIIKMCGNIGKIGVEDSTIHYEPGGDVPLKVLNIRGEWTPPETHAVEMSLSASSSGSEGPLIYLLDSSFGGGDSYARVESDGFHRFIADRKRIGIFGADGYVRTYDGSDTTISYKDLNLSLDDSGGAANVTKFRVLPVDFSGAGISLVANPNYSRGLYDDYNDEWLLGYSPTGVFYAGGQRMSDQVIQIGTSGAWTYRWWASGRKEAWCTYTGSSAVANVWVSPIRYRDININIPNGVFDSAPRVYATSYNNQAWVVSANTSSAVALSVRLATVASGAITPSLRFYCVQG